MRTRRSSALAIAVAVAMAAVGAFGVQASASNGARPPSLQFLGEAKEPAPASPLPENGVEK